MKYYFSCSIYLTNTIVGALLAIVVSAALMLLGVEKFARTLEIRQYADYMQSAIPWIVWMFLIMTNTACCSLSLEGTYIWILETLPIPMRLIYQSKILLNLTVSVPASLVSSVCLCVALKPDFLLGCLYFAAPLSMCTASAVWGIAVNQTFTHLEWESETKVVKQDVTTLLGMFPGLLFAIAAGVLNCVLPVDDRMFLMLVFVTALLFSWILYQKRKDVPWQVKN